MVWELILWEFKSHYNIEWFQIQNRFKYIIWGKWFIATIFMYLEVNVGILNLVTMQVMNYFVALFNI